MKIRTYCKIGFDLDDVLFPCLEEFIAFFKQNGFPHLTVADFHQEGYNEMVGVAREEAINLNKLHFQRLALPLEIPPVAGSQLAIAKLAKRFDLAVVTARQPEYRHLIQPYLDRYFPDIKEVNFGNYYALKGNSKRKSEICQESGIDLLVDDTFTSCLDCAENGIDAILFGDYPWNRLEPEQILPSNVIPLPNWASVLQFLTPPD